MNIILALSGGLDSTVLLANALHMFPKNKPMCVTFAYRSKHNFWERVAADRICEHYDIPYHLGINTIDCFTATKSALISPCDIPLPMGVHHEDPIQKQTIVPGRNLIFTSILAGIAQSQFSEGGSILLGVHRGDEAIYPDCRKGWIDSVYNAIFEQSEGKIQLQAPFIGNTKADIVKLGLELNVPFLKTRTCYKDQQVACGQCGACRERQEAFKLNNTTDDIEYEHPVL